MSGMLLLRSNDRAAVDLVRRDERDLRIDSSRSRQDLIFRMERWLEVLPVDPRDVDALRAKALERTRRGDVTTGHE